jgi:hypothetical protein
MDTTLDKTAYSMLHLLTESEAAILDAANFVKFGELHDVELVQEEPRVSRTITTCQIAFIMALRDEGVTKLDNIIVHNGMPSQIEVYGTKNDIKYKRKIRFN